MVKKKKVKRNGSIDAGREPDKLEGAGSQTGPTRSDDGALKPTKRVKKLKRIKRKDGGAEENRQVASVLHQVLETSGNPKKRALEKAVDTPARPVKRGKKSKKTQATNGFAVETNRALSVLDSMLDPSEQASGAPETLASMVKKAKKGRGLPDRAEETTIDFDQVLDPSDQGSSQQTQHISKAPKTLVQDVVSEESDVEVNPEEEKAKALSVLDQVLSKQDSIDNTVSDDEELQKDGKARALERSSKSRKVFIGNLPWKVEAATLQEDFEKWGEIDTFNMPMNKQTGKPMGIAFIVYTSIEGAERAATQDGTTYAGRTIRVSIADSKATGGQGHPRLNAEQDKGGKAKGKGEGKDGGGDGKSGKDKDKGKGKDKGKTSYPMDKGKGKGKDRGKGKADQKGWNK